MRPEPQPTLRPDALSSLVLLLALAVAPLPLHFGIGYGGRRAAARARGSRAMRIHIFEAGKSRGSRSIDHTVEVQHGTLRLGGGPPCEVVVPGLPPQPVAELRVIGGAAELANTGALPVLVAGRQVPQGGAMPLGPELLLSIGGKELVYRSTPSGPAPAAPGAPGAAAGAPARSPSDMLEHPSAVAKDMLKDVYAALGVPQDAPALVVYDKDNKVQKRVDLVPPHESVSIGRDPGCQIVLYHQSVSKQHAQVMRDGVGFVVKDLGSKNGTQLNGKPVSGLARLSSGDRLAVGQFTLRFVDPKAAMADLAASVPDLRRIERAKPGEQVRVGGGGDLEETTGFEQSVRKQAEADEAAKSGSASGGAAAPGQAKDEGVSPLVYVIVGVGVLVLAGIVVAIALSV